MQSVKSEKLTTKLDFPEVNIFKHPELSQKTLSAYTKITDDVIELAAEIGKAEFIRNNHVDPPIVTILAVGGYGRAEMAPFSDIDLLFLLTDKDPSSDKQLIEAILYVLWDMKLKIGYAVRTISECIYHGKKRFHHQDSTS